MQMLAPNGAKCLPIKFIGANHKRLYRKRNAVPLYGLSRVVLKQIAGHHLFHREIGRKRDLRCAAAAFMEAHNQAVFIFGLFDNINLYAVIRNADQPAGFL